MTIYLGVLIVLLAMAAGVLVMAVVARRSPEGSLSDRTPTNVYTVTGGAISLLIAFTFAAAFGMYTSVQSSLRTEAAETLAMFRTTEFMEEPLRTQLQTQVRCYPELVATVEWPALAHGNLEVTSPVQDTLVSMDRLVSTPEGVKQAGAALADFEGASDAMLAARVERIAAAEWGVPPIVYVMIILGALITIGSLFVFADRSKPLWGHALIIIGPIFVVAAGLTVTYFFDNPFVETPGGITPEPLVMVGEYMSDWVDSSAPLQCPQVVPPAPAASAPSASALSAVTQRG